MPKKSRRKIIRARRKKPEACWFCKNNRFPDYKDLPIIAQFLTSKGKIVAKRESGLCAIHQRQLAVAVKRARNVALV